jgi:hypothetical protein
MPDVLLIDGKVLPLLYVNIVSPKNPENKLQFLPLLCFFTSGFHNHLQIFGNGMNLSWKMKRYANWYR